MKRYACYSLALAILISNQSVADENLLAIDVGHSALRPGTTSATGIPEFVFNAALANTVSDFISSHSTPVVRIGHDGNMVELKKRTLIANEARAKFFLSIHHDSVQTRYLKQWEWHGTINQYSDYASGFSLFVSRKNPHWAASLQCATTMGIALRKKGLHPSLHHAEKIPGEAREWADQENGVYYYDDLIVLKTAQMPAVLLEAGVIVNQKEEQAIQKTEMQNTIAVAIENGLRDCGVINK